MSELPIVVRVIAALSPVLVLVSAIAAAAVAAFTLTHRRRQDRKDEWWRRTQWAIDRALSSDVATQRVGLTVPKLHARSSFADAEDGRVVEAVVTDVLLETSPATRAAGVHYAVHTPREGEIP